MSQPVLRFPPSDGGAWPALRTAWRARRRAAREPASLVLAPIRGGAAGLLGPDQRARLISLLTGTPDDGASRLRSWLERRQARQSALLVAPDRDTAVAFALRWGLDLSRIRVVASLDTLSAEQLTRDLTLSATKEPAWHSTRRD